MTGVMARAMTAARCGPPAGCIAFRGMTMTTTPAEARTAPRFPLPVRAVLTLAAMFVAAFSGLIMLVLPAGGGQLAAMHLCATVTGVGLAVALVRGVDRRPVAALGLGRPALGAGLAALAVTAACTAAGTGLAVASGLTTPAAQVPGISVWAVLMLLSQSFLLQAVPEEVLFRGYLVQTALGRLTPYRVTALSVLVFGVPHLLSRSGASTVAEQVLFLSLPLGFGLLATAFRLWTGSVWPAVAVHGGFHLSWWVASRWVTPRPESYGAYLAVTGTVLLAVGLAAAWWAVRRTPAASPGCARPGSGGSGPR